MPNCALISISILFGCLLSVDIFAQGNTRYFHHLSTEDGLPQSSVNAIVQDHLGFMWFGTEDGLARYDGYTFHVYRNNIADSTSLSNNFINTLMVDDEGHIWVGTSKGLSVYDPKTDRFSSFYHSEKDSTTFISSLILSIFQDSRGDIFIGTNSGLYKVVSENNHHDLTFHRYKTSLNPDNLEIFEGTVHDFTEDQWGQIWFASQGKDPLTREDNGALTCYDPHQETFTHYFTDSVPNGLSSNAVRSLYSQNNTLWVGTIDGGLNKIIFANECKILSVRMYQNGKKATDLPHNYVSKIIDDAQSTIWIGTYEGLVSTNSETERFYNNIEFEQLSSTSSPIIRDLFIDNAGNIWAATDKGLFVHYSSSRQFTLYQHDPNDSNSIVAGDIFGITEDSMGNLWAVSFGTGLSRIRDAAGQRSVINSYTFNGVNPVLPTSQLLGITEDKDKNLWIASFDGLIKISKPGRREELDLTHFPPEKLTIGKGPRKYYTRIFTHPNGSLWVRTYQNGIDIIQNHENDLRIKNLTTISFENEEYRIQSFFMDEGGILWIITDLKLFRGTIDDKGNLNVIPVTFVSNEWEDLLELKINYILETESESIWIGTSNGLARLYLDQNSNDKTTKYHLAELKIYTENDGLPNNTVYAIAADDHQNLWLSTNKGLSKFSIQNESFVNHLLEGGPAINEFNEAAVAKGKKGHIYFGGIGGLVRFHPDSILQNPFIPPVVITDIHVLNKKLPVYDDRITFADNDNMIEELTLPYTDNFFTVHFSALNFNQPEKNEYAYKLRGFHDEWIFTGQQRQATFTNLDVGEYTFQVIGSNNDGMWNATGASLKITILPPFWETRFAYAFYIFVFLLAGYLFIRQRIRKATRDIEIRAQIERAKHEERERFRKKTSQDFHDEAGNKITKINLFTELAKAEASNSKKLDDLLRKIQINTHELSSGMRDFIWTMDPDKDTFFDTLMRLKDFGNSMFQDSGTNFETRGVSAHYHKIKLPMDSRRMILLIFKEAMNNCAKYANADHLILEISIKNNVVNMTTNDNGIGFNPDNAIHNKGYGIKNMKERAEKIGGKLTINSKPGCGTEVRLQFNLPHLGNIE